MRQALSFMFLTLLLGSFVILAYSGVGLGKERDIKSMAVEPIKSPSASECGALVIDKATGAMRRKPNVDLVVTRIEIGRNERGLFVNPSIKNRCSEPIPITQHIHVKIGENVYVSFSGLAPQVSTSFGEMSIPPDTSFPITVFVDFNDQIPEANELNNKCTRSETGDCL